MFKKLVPLFLLSLSASAEITSTKAIRNPFVVYNTPEEMQYPLAENTECILSALNKKSLADIEEGEINAIYELRMSHEVPPKNGKRTVVYTLRNKLLSRGIHGRKKYAQIISGDIETTSEYTIYLKSGESIDTDCKSRKKPMHYPSRF